MRVVVGVGVAGLMVLGHGRVVVVLEACDGGEVDGERDRGRAVRDRHSCVALLFF
jgi:hypothetical protein